MPAKPFFSSVLMVLSVLCSEIGGATCNSLLATLAKTGAWRVPTGCSMKWLRGGLVSACWDLGCSFGGFVERMIWRKWLCRTSKVSEALWMLNELKGRGWKPDFMTYWVVAAAFWSMENMVDEVKVFKMKRKLGVAPRSSDYRDLILGLVSERQICEAKEVGEVIVGGNFPVEDDVLNALIRSVSSVNPGAAIMFSNFMVEKERFPTILTVSNLSRNLCRHGKFDELLKVFHVLNSHNYFKDVEGYNMMVSFLCKAGRVREGYAVLQEMKKRGFYPNVSSYNYILEARCKEDLLCPARKLWDEMFSSGCCGNLKTVEYSRVFELVVLFGIF